jgi:hypothetical protein
MIDPEDGKRTCYCGSGQDVHPYAEGDRCDVHAPWARRGHPHPSQGRYCLNRCYCGRCPNYARPLEPVTANVIDFRAAASGKRRVGHAEYRQAQAQTRPRQERPA